MLQFKCFYSLIVHIFVHLFMDNLLIIDNSLMDSPLQHYYIIFIGMEILLTLDLNHKYIMLKSKKKEYTQDKNKMITINKLTNLSNIINFKNIWNEYL